jgi:hypothetical protein
LVQLTFFADGGRIDLGPANQIVESRRDLLGAVQLEADVVFELGRGGGALGRQVDGGRDGSWNGS